MTSVRVNKDRPFRPMFIHSIGAILSCFKWGTVDEIQHTVMFRLCLPGVLCTTPLLQSGAYA